MTKAKQLKQAYLDAARKSLDNGNNNTVYTMEMIMALRDMAKENVYPDGRFGDDDCNVWSMFREVQGK